MTYPQMPVLLMAIVTCPSLRSSPFCTLSSVGVASLIHRSCLGLVKTPMLFLVAFVAAASTVVALMVSKIWPV